jgi:hypothetical protein
MDSTPFSSTADPARGVLLTVRCEECHTRVTTVTGLVSWSPLTRRGDPALTVLCKRCDRSRMERGDGASQAFTLRWLTARLAHALEVTSEEVIEEMKRIPEPPK